MIFHNALDIAEIVRQLLDEGWEIDPEAYDPKLDVDFTPLREQDPAAAGFGHAA